MKELWDEAISLLPPKVEVDTFFLAYRPWIRDRTHLYFAAFRRAQKPNRPFQAPAWVYTYGSTPEDALISFIAKFRSYL